MQDTEILRGKRILVVDDERDILELIEDILDMCVINKASSFEKAKDLLEKNSYDAAILDIMGVKGYELLEITTKQNIPTLMLTAHALSPDNFVESINKGAHAYVPKDKISEIGIFLEDILSAKEKGIKRLGEWFARLEPYFEKEFGAYWKEKEDPDFWRKYY